MPSACPLSMPQCTTRQTNASATHTTRTSTPTSITQGRALTVAPAVKDQHEVTVTFCLPSLRREYATKPDHYLSHLVGHEGPGSLLSALKARGWATDLCAGVEDDGYGANSCCYLFSVAITLTEAGLDAGPGLGLAPAGLLFAYMRALAAGGPQEWVWRELKAISDFKFRCACVCACFERGVCDGDVVWLCVV